MVSSTWRGHTIIRAGDHWEYEDNGVCVVKDPRRTCGICSKPQLPGCDDDPCLGTLPGVLNACCGHGRREESYIQFENGLLVQGFTIGEPDKHATCKTYTNVYTRDV